MCACVIVSRGCGLSVQFSRWVGVRDVGKTGTGPPLFVQHAFCKKATCTLFGLGAVDGVGRDVQAVVGEPR